MLYLFIQWHDQSPYEQLISVSKSYWILTIDFSSYPEISLFRKDKITTTFSMFTDVKSMSMSVNRLDQTEPLQSYTLRWS